MHLLYEILAFSTRYIKLPFSESLILNPSRILYYTEKNTLEELYILCFPDTSQTTRIAGTCLTTALDSCCAVAFHVVTRVSIFGPKAGPDD